MTTYRLQDLPADEPVSSLSERQSARVEALKAARDVLAARAVLTSGPVDAIDVVNVALYIETGNDPYALAPVTSGGDEPCPLSGLVTVTTT